MSMRESGSSVGVESLGGPVGFFLLIAGGWVLWSLFELSLALAVGAIAFVAVCVFLLNQVAADNGAPEGAVELDHRQKLVVIGLIVLAILGALLIYPLAVAFRLVPFAVAGWTTAGLFFASLLAGAWIAISGLGRMLAMIAGAACVAALVVLPAPRGAADPTDAESEWKITLTVFDENGAAMPRAVAQCSAAMIWDAEGPVTFHHTFAQLTDEEGKAAFTFHEDTRLKAAVCTALKEEADGPVWMMPDQDNFDRALYPPKSVIMASPLPGRDYKLTLTLEPRKR